jgi:hypothetical protein
VLDAEASAQGLLAETNYFFFAFGAAALRFSSMAACAATIRCDLPRRERGRAR